MMRLGHEFIEALDALAVERGLDIEVILSTMEAAMLSAYNKYQPGEFNMEIKVDHDTGDISIYELRKVVSQIGLDPEVPPEQEITLQDAKRYDLDAQIGDTIRIERNPTNFGRIAAQTARQVITQRLRDEERRAVFTSFADKVGDMVIGTIYKVEGDDIVIHINDRTDAELPKRERIRNERYTPGTSMKFYVLEVKQKARGPHIIVSRTHPGLLKKLMEVEIPEIKQGIIEIRNIVRDPGLRAKVALVTLDPNVDPLGACIGSNGSRIKAISGALKGEKVDIVIYNNDPVAFIKNALSPAQVSRVDVMLDKEKEVTAYVYPDQLSLAIGRGGQNVKLAAKLTGYKINVQTIEPDKMPTLKDIFSDVFDKS